MRVSFNMNRKDIKTFERRCDVAITKVGNGSRKALQEACEVISDKSLEQVPYDTGTLSLSQYYEITGDYRNGWTGVVGYGGNGDPVNPRTGQKASEYVVAVHEDLKAYHPIGKAKFLEDPVREFARERFPRTVMKHVSSELNN